MESLNKAHDERQKRFERATDQQVADKAQLQREIAEINLKLTKARDEMDLRTTESEDLNKNIVQLRKDTIAAQTTLDKLIAQNKVADEQGKAKNREQEEEYKHVEAELQLKRQETENHATRIRALRENIDVLNHQTEEALAYKNLALMDETRLRRLIEIQNRADELEMESQTVQHLQNELAAFRATVGIEEGVYPFNFNREQWNNLRTFIGRAADHSMMFHVPFDAQQPPYLTNANGEHI
jgi:chromosome segregation ATPase